MSDEPAKRAVIYTRVSTTRGREDNMISFEVQEGHARRVCEQRGWEVVTVIKDPDRKGSTLDRPGLNEARRMIRDDEADAIVVWKLSRFARTAMGALLALQDIIKDGGIVVSTDQAENLDTSDPVGWAVAHLMFAIAEQELNRIRGTWRDATTHAVHEGLYMSSAPFGYEKGDDRRLAIVPERAAIIRELFDMAAAGVSKYAMTRWARETHGLKWSESAIGYMLANRAYRGELFRNTKEGRLVNKEAHPPLVDELLWRRANAQSPPSGKAKRRLPPRLLQGIARCAGCRSSLQVADRGGSRQPFYQCGRTGNHGDCPAPAYVNAARLEAFVEPLFLEWYERERADFDDDDGHDELDALDVEIAQAEQDLLDYRDPKVKRAYGADWLSGLDSFLVALDDLRQQREELLTALHVPTALGAISSVDDYLGRSVEQRRMLLGSAIDFVFVGPSAYAGRANASMRAIEERTRVIFHPHGLRVDVPRSGGGAFDWRPFVFDTVNGDGRKAAD